ncbi:hypothetical protein [Luethyella okanaganae]|uniref:YHS domain-containing protein n=1 Tax=Luethyella okanaganae TaxID=69372 RepID=A0ABW1VFK1_9MICO
MSDSCCGHQAADTTDAAMSESAHNLLATDGADVAECPVMKGSMVDKAEAEAAGLVREYEGKQYWLCCAGCGPLFDANPAQYATA